MFTGMLTLTAFCGASADDSAVCVVFDSWQDSCAWPGPPQPKLQLEPLEVWLWVLLWVVVPVLLAGPLFALLVGVWVAVLLPPAVIEPAAMFTGMLTLTTFCSASADETAVCVVFDFCPDNCA